MKFSGCYQRYIILQEQENLVILKERIAKSSQLTKGMDRILNSFEQRLSKLEETILPVYNETENLRRCQHSILLYALIILY